MKEILKKYWNRKRFLILHSSDNYPEFTNDDISEGHIKCEECTRQLWSDTKKSVIGISIPLFQLLNRVDNEAGDSMFGVCK